MISHNTRERMISEAHFSVAPSGRKPQQSKMLNIARRLVASMTTEDLQFQDAEGDT